MIPSLVSKSSPLLLYSHYNIFQLICNPHMWFMNMGPVMFKNYEFITIVINGMVITLGSIFTISKFKKEDIN